MGTGEVLVIIIVALLIWGPNRIVEIARTLGKMLRALRNITSDLTAALTKEIDMVEKERPSRTRANSDDKTKKPPDSGGIESMVRTLRNITSDLTAAVTKKPPDSGGIESGDDDKTKKPPDSGGIESGDDDKTKKPSDSGGIESGDMIRPALETSEP